MYYSMLVLLGTNTCIVSIYTIHLSVTMSVVFPYLHPSRLSVAFCPVSVSVSSLCLSAIFLSLSVCLFFFRYMLRVSLFLSNSAYHIRGKTLYALDERLILIITSAGAAVLLPIGKLL